MLGIGEKFPTYALTGVVSNDPNKAFVAFQQQRSGRQMAGRVFLAQGLHLRLPDRDRRVRQAQSRIQRSRRAAVRRQRRQRVRASGMAQGKGRAAQPAVPDAVGHQARAQQLRWESWTSEAGVAQRATYIVDPEGVIRFVYVTDLSVGRNPAGSAARARCTADRRAVPVQLAEGPGDPQGGLRWILRHSIPIRDLIPDYARDLKLNLGSVLTPDGCAGAERAADLVGGAGLGDRLAQQRVHACHRGGRGRAARCRPSAGGARGGGHHGHEQHLLPFPAPGRGRGVPELAGAAAHEHPRQLRASTSSTSSCCRWRCRRSMVAACA